MGSKSLSLLLHSPGGSCRCWISALGAGQLLLPQLSWARRDNKQHQGHSMPMASSACSWLPWLRRHLQHPETLKLFPSPWTWQLGTDSLRDLIRNHLAAAISKDLSVLPTYPPLALQICSQTCTELQKFPCILWKTGPLVLVNCDCLVCNDQEFCAQHQVLHSSFF